ncbi:MAG: reverse transcriptase/maturase family protein [Desulfobacterium sp.]
MKQKENMKRYGNLYSKISDLKNIEHAHHRARKGKRHYNAVKNIDSNSKKYFQGLHEIFANNEYRTSEYQVMTKNTSGKTRVIYKLPYYPDRIAHHCIMNILEPIWESVLIRDTYSSIKGRGIHDGVARVKGFLSDVPGTQYCLKIDVKKFYPSIDHKILKDIIRKKIKCAKTLSLLDEIIESTPGVPIGNYLSQYFGNLYLAYFDHWCKEILKIQYYARYCDDVVIFGPDKPGLHVVLKTIVEYLRCNLKLELNKNYQIFPTAVRGVDFLGYRFFGDYTLIRKGIASRFKRQMLKIDHGNAHMKPLQCRSSVMSYKGWFAHADSHRLWDKYFTPNIEHAVTLHAS